MTRDDAAYRIMAHMIPFFPDYDASVQVASALIDGGASYLEIQFPYSDPTADGPAIQGACATALDRGFTVSEGWRFVRDLTARTPVPVFVMSYAGLVYAHEVQRFVKTAADAGVSGLIVPDLPVDSDEGLFAAAADAGVHAVPVIAMGAGESRLRLIESVGAEYVYASLRRGTTGSHTEIGPENSAFVDRLARSGARVLAGFGIATREQVRAVLDHAHAAVVGSAFVRAIGENPTAPADPVRRLCARLSGIG